MKTDFWSLLIVMAGVTYLLRMLPLVLVRKKITNRFLLSFLYYIPYAVLSVMTIPACFYATGHLASAIAGFAAAIIVAYFKSSLILVAASASLGALIAETVIMVI